MSAPQLPAEGCRVWLAERELSVTGWREAVERVERVAASNNFGGTKTIIASRHLEGEFTVPGEDIHHRLVTVECPARFEDGRRAVVRCRAAVLRLTGNGVWEWESSGEYKIVK